MNSTLTLVLSLALFQTGPAAPAAPFKLNSEQQYILELEFELKLEEIACERILARMREVQKELGQSFERSNALQRRIADRRAQLLRTVRQPEEIVGHHRAERRLHQWLAEQKDWTTAYARIEKMHRDANFFVELDAPHELRGPIESLSRALIELEFACLLMEHKEYEKAAAHCQRAISRSRKDLPLAHALHGQALEKLGKLPEAMKAYEIAQLREQQTTDVAYKIATTSARIARTVETPAAAVARLKQ